jgi:hypothetical protein
MVPDDTEPALAPVTTPPADGPVVPLPPPQAINETATTMPASSRVKRGRFMQHSWCVSPGMALAKPQRCMGGCVLMLQVMHRRMTDDID